MKPLIHVMSYSQLSTSECPQMMPVYHLDQTDGGLAMPTALYVGNGVLSSYRDQVWAYRAWLEDEVKAKNPRVLVALDNIYNQSVTTGVIIATLAQEIPFYTHAHIVRETILALAEGDSIT